MRTVKIGEKYRHFKGHEYIITDIVKDSETLEDLIIYEDLKDKTKKWARSYNMFVSLVDKEKYPEIKQKYRFEKIK